VLNNEKSKIGLPNDWCLCMIEHSTTVLVHRKSKFVRTNIPAPTADTHSWQKNEVSSPENVVVHQ
jgi:hypothetical protein